MQLLQQLADAINSGGKLILTVLACVVLGAVLYVGYRRFVHKSDLMKPPESGMERNWQQADFSNEAELLEYINLWLRNRAPHVLGHCVPQKLSVTDCPLTMTAPGGPKK